VLITLSGTHGAGKSTTAGRCYYVLSGLGLRLSFLRHQDILDPFGFVVRRTARLLGLTEHELDGMRPVRVLWALYILLIYVPLVVGGIHTRRLLGYSVVCDRYVYDLLVGFRDNDQRVPTEEIVLRLVPRADISFVLDAPEERILNTRPEHSREFIRKERMLYEHVAEHFQLVKVNTEAPVATVWERISKEIESVLAGKIFRN
jgi:thymidylate kinase